MLFEKTRLNHLLSDKALQKLNTEVHNQLNLFDLLPDRVDGQARDPKGAFNRDSILAVKRIFRKEGFVEKETPYDKLIDSGFAADAARALGPFEALNIASQLRGCR